MNRLTSSGKMPLTMRNWRGIWVSAIVLAQKVWDDNPLKTSSFICILPSVTKEQLRDLERKALALIEFVTGVKPSLYAKYYFELRQLFADITGNDTSFEWKLKPLTIIESKQLEDRSRRNVLQNREWRVGSSTGSGSSSAKSTPKAHRSSSKSTSSASSSAGKQRSAHPDSSSASTSASSLVPVSVGGSTGASSTPGARSPVPVAHHTYEDVTRVDTSRYVIS